MAIIETINSAINGVVWGVPMLVLLVGAGILLTIRTFGVQFRKFGYAMKNTLGKVFTKTEAKEGEMTPFQAVPVTSPVSPPPSRWAALVPCSGCGSPP